MIINWFSALPPLQSAGAELTRSSLSRLAQRADVVVWSNKREWDRTLEQHADVRFYDAGRPPWGEFNRAAVTIFHLGDDADAFGSIWTISRRHPGIIILHETDMQPHFIRLAAEERFLTVLEYLALAESHHSGTGRSSGELFLRGKITIEELAARCSMVGAAIWNALAVIVHTESAREHVFHHTTSPVYVIANDQPPDQYVAAMMRVLEHLPEHEALWSARVMSRRVGEAIEQWCSAPEAAELLPRIVDEIGFLNRAT